MLRKTRFWFGCALVVGASFTMLGPIGCGIDGNNNNTEKKCTDTGFVGCDAGNTCNATSGKCECDKTACGKLDNSACNPQTNTCDTHCTDDTQCTDATRNKCSEVGAKKFCVDATKDLCTGDADCGDTFKCDTAKSPKVCVKGGPSTDKECETADAAKPAFDATSGACVECVEDKHCLNGEKCQADTKTCKAGGCVDTKTCFGTDPKTYCDDAAKEGGCKTATASCDADNKVTAADNSGWNGTKGGVIWGVKAERVTADACWSYKKDNGQTVPCTDSSDCDTLGSGVKCFPLGSDKFCGTPNANGLVEVSFNFYNPSQIETGFKGVTTHSKDGLPTDKLAITSGDGTAGVAKFGICLDGGGSYQFFAKDKNGDPSNAGCYTVAAR